MKSAARYIFSFIFSILLVFTVIATCGLITAGHYAASSAEANINKIAVDSGCVQSVRKELEKYFSERQAVTGIPVGVYMDEMSDELIADVIREEIVTGWAVMRNKILIFELNDGFHGFIMKRHDALSQQKALSKYYSDYADSIGYKKDEVYDQKLANEQANTRSIFYKYCDVFKFGALIDNGVMEKVVPYYPYITPAMFGMIGAVMVLILIIFLIDLKEARAVLYWSGISAIVGGLIGALPCLYLTATDYFSAFTIKQPQVYAAYTGAMKTVTGSFMTASAIAAAVGAVLVILYAVSCKKTKEK